jgi:hypothetical protein
MAQPTSTPAQRKQEADLAKTSDVLDLDVNHVAPPSLNADQWRRGAQVRET